MKHDRMTELKKSVGWDISIYNPKLLEKNLLNKGICLLSGHNGAGKTSISKYLAQHFNCNHFQMDWFENIGTKFTDEKSIGYQTILEFLNDHNVQQSELETMDYDRFCCLQTEFLFKLLQVPAYNDKPLIIEGTQIIRRSDHILKQKIGDGTLYSEYPLILIERTFTQAMINAFIRDNPTVSYKEYKTTRSDMYHSWESALECFNEYAIEKDLSSCKQLFYENETVLKDLLNDVADLAI
jgi:hypothetical protein